MVDFFFLQDFRPTGGFIKHFLLLAATIGFSHFFRLVLTAWLPGLVGQSPLPLIIKYDAGLISGVTVTVLWWQS